MLELFNFMWTDNETTTDLIGFKVHADLIRSVVTNEDLLPTVLGVFGDWGGGKSSIMQMIREDLDHDDYEDVVCLYFNGWMFEGYQDAKTALLSSILVQLREHKRFGKKTKDYVTGLLKRVNYMEFLKTGGKVGWKYGLPLLVTYLSGAAVPAIIPAVAGSLATKTKSEEEDGEGEIETGSQSVNWSKFIKASEGDSDVVEIREFRDDFEEMLEATKIKSLVILIDDLDRCLPDRIIETLEAIKLFVLVPRTAFIIGADPRIVRHAIGTRYAAKQLGESDTYKNESDELVKDYLEKLIQIPYQLPRLSPAEIETYINLLACQKFLDESDNQRILHDWSTKRSQNFYSSYQLGAIRAVLGDGEIKPELESQLNWSNSIAQVVTEGLKGNPRQVKRMLNALMLRKKLAEVAQIQIREEVLAKLMVLEYTHLSRFYELNDWQVAEEGRPEKLAKLEANARNDVEAVPITTEDNLNDWQSGSLEKWLRMEPSLKDVDLRDYFWLARDRTSSTLAGVNMVSPLVRRIFNSLTDGNEGEQEIAVRESASLDESERESLLGLLSQFVSRHPGQGNGYEGLLKLATGKIAGAGYAFLKAVREASPPLIPASVAPKIKALGVIDDQLSKDAENLLSSLAKDHPKTAIGKAAARELEA